MIKLHTKDQLHTYWSFGQFHESNLCHQTAQQAAPTTLEKPSCDNTTPWFHEDPCCIDAAVRCQGTSGGLADIRCLFGTFTF